MCCHRPFCVDPDRKGTGLGSRIMTALKTYARDELKATTLEINVINHRSDLFPMYEHLGFAYTGVTKAYSAENGFNERRLSRPSHFVYMQIKLV